MSMLQFYGLREQPFGTTPDPRFFYDLPAHREAAASLICGMEYRVGFAALLAEPGLGKTTILYDIIHQYEKKAETAFIFNTLGSASSLLQRIAEDLGVPASEDLAQTHENLKLFVAERGGKRPVLVIIDEAQNLDDEALEAVRLLSDFETANCKLLHIILAGQPQLATKLSQDSMVQLLQRITMIARLQRLSSEETLGYIRHRSRIAGSERDLFSPAALNRIAVASGGIPREINRICFNALLLGFAARQTTVPVTVIEEVLADLKCTPDDPKIVETEFSPAKLPQTFRTSSTFQPSTQRIAPGTESTHSEWSGSLIGNRPETPVTPSLPAVTQTQPLAAIPGIQPVIARPATEDQSRSRVESSDFGLSEPDIVHALETAPYPLMEEEEEAPSDDHIRDLDDGSFADRMNARLRAMADVANENPRRRGPITPTPSALPSAGLSALAQPVPEAAHVVEPAALATHSEVVEKDGAVTEDASDRWRLAMVPAEKADIFLEEEDRKLRFTLPEYWQRYALAGVGVLAIAFLSLPPVHRAIGRFWHDLFTAQPVIADVRPTQTKGPVASPAHVTVSVTPPPKRYRVARVEEAIPVPATDTAAPPTDTAPPPQPSNGTGLTILGTPSVTKVEGDSAAPIVSMARATEPSLPAPPARKPARVYLAEPTPPKLLAGKDPEYPSTAKSLHMEGSVSMKVQIGTDGKVTGVSVQDGPSLFVTAATAAVKQWTYQPAMLNGRPVASELALKIDFSLNPQK